MNKVLTNGSCRFIVKIRTPKDVLTLCLDGLSLAMTTNYELNQKRRDATKFHFKNEFAKGLCSSTNPTDKFLFGGETALRVKDVAELLINANKNCKIFPLFCSRI